MSDRRVDNTYDKLKSMAVGFEIKPGDRLNEVSLSKSLGVSRTPLREALNRLVAEKLFDFRPGAGFFCRALDAQTIFDLFELRAILEPAAAKHAAERADQAELQAMHDDLYAHGLSVSNLTVADACARDELFHISIAQASGNAELVGELERLNERIRYIRWVRMAGSRVKSSKDEHKMIMAALLKRDGDGAAAAMAGHIEGRKDQIAAAVREGISNIYMDPNGALAGRVLAEDDE